MKIQTIPLQSMDYLGKFNIPQALQTFEDCCFFHTIVVLTIYEIRQKL